MQVVNPAPSAAYSGISNAMFTITKVEGFRSLWRGLSSVVVGAGPAHAVYFATYETVKHAMGGNAGQAHQHHPLAAGRKILADGGKLTRASGQRRLGHNRQRRADESLRRSVTLARGSAGLTITVIKQRMQLQNSAYKTLYDCARTVMRKEGMWAFYVSYPTTLCMTVPFTALQFTAYESISKVLNPTGKYDPYTHCFAGGVAGGFAAGVTTPLDVIKTLLQTRGSATDPELRNVRGLWHAATLIRKRNGWRGFLRGLNPRIVTTMPSTAICWYAPVHRCP
jgi:asparaginyl-tRNA synthetase